MSNNDGPPPDPPGSVSIEDSQSVRRSRGGATTRTTGRLDPTGSVYGAVETASRSQQNSAFRRPTQRRFTPNDARLPHVSPVPSSNRGDPASALSGETATATALGRIFHNLSLDSHPSSGTGIPSHVSASLLPDDDMSTFSGRPSALRPPDPVHSISFGVAYGNGGNSRSSVTAHEAQDFGAPFAATTPFEQLTSAHTARGHGTAITYDPAGTFVTVWYPPSTDRTGLAINNAGHDTLLGLGFVAMRAVPAIDRASHYLNTRTSTYLLGDLRGDPHFRARFDDILEDRLPGFAKAVLGQLPLSAAVADLTSQRSVTRSVSREEASQSKGSLGTAPTAASSTPSSRSSGTRTSTTWSASRAESVQNQFSSLNLLVTDRRSLETATLYMLNSCKDHPFLGSGVHDDQGNMLFQTTDDNGQAARFWIDIILAFSGGVFDARRLDLERALPGAGSFELIEELKRRYPVDQDDLADEVHDALGRVQGPALPTVYAQDKFREITKAAQEAGVEIPADLARSFVSRGLQPLVRQKIRELFVAQRQTEPAFRGLADLTNDAFVARIADVEKLISAENGGTYPPPVKASSAHVAEDVDGPASWAKVRDNQDFWLNEKRKNDADPHYCIFRGRKMKHNARTDGLIMHAMDWSYVEGSGQERFNSIQTSASEARGRPQRQSRERQSRGVSASAVLSVPTPLPADESQSSPQPEEATCPSPSPAESSAVGDEVVRGPALDADPNECDSMSDGDAPARFDCDWGEDDSASSTPNNALTTVSFPPPGFPRLPSASSVHLTDPPFLDRSGPLPTIEERVLEEAVEEVLASASHSPVVESSPTRDVAASSSDATDPPPRAPLPTPSTSLHHVDVPVDAWRDPEFWTTEWRRVPGRHSALPTPSPSASSVDVSPNPFLDLASDGDRDNEDARIAASWAPLDPRYLLGESIPEDRTAKDTEAAIANARRGREERRQAAREAKDRRRQRRLARTRGASPVAVPVVPAPSGRPLRTDPPQHGALDFAVGTLVELDGLRVAAQFNGRVGRVVRYDPRSQRWGVRLLDGGHYLGVATQHLSRVPRNSPWRRRPATTPIDDPCAVGAPPRPTPGPGPPPPVPSQSPSHDADAQPTPADSMPTSPVASASSADTTSAARASVDSTRLSDLAPEQQIDLLFPELQARRKRSKRRNRGDKVVVFVQASSVSKMERCEGDKAVADTGATHDLHNRLEDFRSFKRLYNQFVQLPNKAQLPILGVGDIVVDLGGRRVLLRNVYYVPGLRIPLFSLRVHRRRPGCGHHADNDGFFITFPTFDVDVRDNTDSYIPFTSVSQDVDVSTLDYTEPSAADRRLYSASASSGALRRSRRLREKQSRSDWDQVVGGDFDGDFDRLDQECVDIGECVANAEPSPASLPPGAVSAFENVVSDTSADVAAADNAIADEPSPAPTPEILVETVDDTVDELEVEDVDVTVDEAPKPTSDSISSTLLLSFHADPDAPAPAVRPCDTPNESDSKAILTPDIIHKYTGGRRFRGKNGYSNHASIFLEGTASFTNGGEPLQTLGEVVNQAARKRGGSLPPTKHYLDKVHMDIVFGDVISKLGFRYALLLVDRATKYIWVYGLKSLTSVYLIEALEQFRADAGGLPRQFRCDCDQKLLGGNTRRWIYRHESKVIGAPAGRQSANGLVERAWQTLCAMARAYLTDAGMSRDYWFFAIAHAARMMNYIPGKVDGKLTTSFELVHRVKPNGRTLFPLFSIVYFSQNKTTGTDSDADASGDRSTFMSRSQVGIAVGRSTKTNALRVYSPSTKQYYEPDTYSFDPSRRPSNEWPDQIQYDGGLYVNLYRDSHHNKVPEPYPPGMPFKLPGDDDHLIDVIVSALPVRSASGEVLREHYLLQKPDGSLVTKTLQEMDELADAPANRVIPITPPSTATASLPVWLQDKSKVSMLNDDGDYDKGFIILSSNGQYRFSCRRQLSSRQEAWGVDLPDFASNWTRLSSDNIILPSWNIGLYTRLGLKPSTPPYDKSGKLVAAASHVSARDLKSSCPKSLREALAEDAVDRDIWLASYHEEKDSLIDNKTFVRLSLQQYRELRLKKNAPRAIPSMCVHTIKRDENGAPARAKSRIVVLGNLEQRLWEKCDRYAPVLQYSSLRLLTSMAIEARRPLKQGDYKNAFVQASLPEDEITIVRPPPGDPDVDLDEFWLLEKSLYGLRRAPKHWYDKMSSSLKAMGLRPSASDPCLFIGVPSSPDHPASPGDKPIQVGIYVDDFVYYSEDDAVESRFESILKDQFKIDFMGTVNWFLGTHFEWAEHDNGALSVHLSQKAFAQNLVERHRLHTSNVNPSSSPYRSGVPIDSIPASDVDDSDPTFVRRRQSYQSLVGGLNWLATNTRPDLSTVVSFLAAYNHCPSKGHMDAALHVVRYLRSTASHGIAFHSSAPATSEAYVHYPFPHDAEAYHDCTPLPNDKPHLLSVYTDANFGSQLGNSVPDGSEIEMFKFRSMSGFLIMRCGGPIAWKAVRQERCSRSTCEAEVIAIDEATKEVLSLRHRCDDMSLPDSSIPTPVFNDNSGAVQWSKNSTSKGLRHVNVRHCAVRDSIRLKEIAIFHVSGKVNPSDIFTKEMRDTAHFCTLRDSFMMSAESFATFVSASSVWVSASCVAGLIL